MVLRQELKLDALVVFLGRLMFHCVISIGSHIYGSRRMIWVDFWLLDFRAILECSLILEVSWTILSMGIPLADCMEDMTKDLGLHSRRTKHVMVWASRKRLWTTFHLCFNYWIVIRPDLGPKPLARRFRFLRTGLEPYSGRFRF